MATSRQADRRGLGVTGETFERHPLNNPPGDNAVDLIVFLAVSSEAASPPYRSLSSYVVSCALVCSTK
jgi:hypothetical protein